MLDGQIGFDNAGQATMAGEIMIMNMMMKINPQIVTLNIMACRAVTERIHNIKILVGLIL